MCPVRQGSAKLRPLAEPLQGFRWDYVSEFRGSKIQGANMGIRNQNLKDRDGGSTEKNSRLEKCAYHRLWLAVMRVGFRLVQLDGVVEWHGVL